ncbi:unnamed protein product [Phytophthora fragariaefolia]|uniref:Unnamed protein product n=1 Tax=Phytophthora fragariaefolia TaxID=1490495 RepID=A0A9W6TM88_9STRA|nr:unnamed protein product [Phytophthora fragariaefolia]
MCEDSEVSMAHLKLAKESGIRDDEIFVVNEEVISITTLTEREGEDGNKVTTNSIESADKIRKVITNWGSTSMNSSMRQKSFRLVPKDMPSSLLSQKTTIAQLYQNEFVGLNVKPSDLAQFSETRSKLRLTKPMANILLSAIVFVDPSMSHSEEPVLEYENQRPGSSKNVLHKIILIPSILKSRQQRRRAIVRSSAAVDAQRVLMKCIAVFTKTIFCGNYGVAVLKRSNEFTKDTHFGSWCVNGTCRQE